MHNKISNEELIKEVVKSAVEDVDIEMFDKEAVWLRIQAQLERDHIRKRRKQRWKSFGIAMASLLLLVSLLSHPTSTSAFTNLISVVEEWREDVVRLVIRTTEEHMPEGTALTSPPPLGDDIGIHIEAMPMNVPHPVTLAEARQLLAMPLLLPDEEILGLYELELVEIMFDELRGGYHWVGITYESEDDTLFIVQEKLPEDFIRTVEYDRELTHVKQINIGRNDGYIIVFPKHEKVIVEWMIDDRLIMINGKMSEEYGLELANSLK